MSAGFDEQRCVVAAGPAPARQGLVRRLDAGLFANDVSEPSGERAVHPIEHGVGLDRPLAEAESAYPFTQGRLIVRVYGLLIGQQIEPLFGRV